MSKRKSTSAAAAEKYDSDGGVVADAPKGKKVKSGKGVKNGAGTSKEGGKKEGDKEGGKKEKKKKQEGESVVGGGSVGKDGEAFWELTSKRRVGITEFKGNNMISIREYYEKDGEALPGKKGISLPLEQFNTLIKLLPHIETVLAEKGQSIERPDYSGAGESASADEEEEEEEDEVVEKKAEKGKQNFEETSESESEKE